MPTPPSSYQQQYSYCPAAEEPVKHQSSPDLRYACCGKPVPSAMQDANAPPPDQNVLNIWCPIANTAKRHTATKSQRFGCCGRLVPAALRIKTEADNTPIKIEYGNSKRTTAVQMTRMDQNSKATIKQQSFPLPSGVEVICLDSDEEDSSNCVVASRSTPAVITGSFKSIRPLKDIVQRQHVEAARRATFLQVTSKKNRFQLCKFRMYVPDICEHSGVAKNALTPSNKRKNESQSTRQVTVIAATPISETRHLQFWIGPASQRWSSFKLLGTTRYTFRNINQLLPPVEQFIVNDLLPLSADYEEQSRINPAFKPPFIRAQILPFFSRSSGPVRLARDKENPKTVRDLLRELPTQGTTIKGTTIYVVLEYDDSDNRVFSEGNEALGRSPSPESQKPLPVKRERDSTSPIPTIKTERVTPLRKNYEL
ncbi:hypothetical protein FN846DRAFT_896488 [Sphaerosporella brunnea]|uniref:Uncharacterized protein n=1 Tax=Sphaerosporella brunnea TaxID=1250544 RepID=A0A5J5EBH5_9PEZI|nr:hypothetical protein FN846DRAFT_896488 [Sphaerosporella brunnea]